MKLEGKSLKSDFLRFIIPSIIAQWVFSLYTMVDGIFVARGVSEVALTAVNISMPFTTGLFSVSILFAVGNSTIVAIFLGQGEKQKANEVFTQNVVLLCILSVLITILVMIFLDPFARFLGATDHILPYARTYIGTIAPFSVVYILSYSFETLIKTDGYPTYNFANVVDDHLQEITHVVRGNEYLSSAPKYNRLYEAFGWEVPEYVHCPTITDENHKKLSKRCGHSSVEDLLDQGFLPEAIINFVALLGWSPTEDREIFSLKELEEVFDYHHISKSPAVFDIVKLRWMNGEYIKAMDMDAYMEHALPVVKEVVTKDYDLKKIAELLKTRIEVFPDIKEKIDFFEELPEYDVAMYTHKKMKTNTENSLEVLQDMLPRLEAMTDFSIDEIEEVCKAYIAEKELKNGRVLWPLRTAVSGKQMTPGGAYEIMEILGKEESLARIRKGIEMLSEAADEE